MLYKYKEPYDAIDIANLIVNCALKRGDNLTPMKLMKLVYVIHGWYLALTHKPLINESIIKGKYGPFVSSIYQHFPKSKKPIKEYTNYAGGISDKSKQIIFNLYNVYVGFSDIDMGVITSIDDSPWANANSKSIIDNELIKKYYQHKINQLK